MTVSVAANDNHPVEHLVGSGNVKWFIGEHFGRLTVDEVFTVSHPLRLLHEITLQAVEVMRTDTAAEGCGAVYVVGDVHGNECKIGKALDPIQRLAQLQTGNPNQLFLHRVFWLRSHESDVVELLAHEIAEETYTRLHGEWFQCSPDQAHNAVVDAIKSNREIKSYCAMTPFSDIMEVASDAA